MFFHPPVRPAIRPILHAVLGVFLLHTAAAADIGVSIRNEVDAALEKSWEFLAAEQDADGLWQGSSLPAVAFLDPEVLAYDIPDEFMKAATGALDRLEKGLPYGWKGDAFARAVEDTVVATLGAGLTPGASSPRTDRVLRAAERRLTLRPEAVPPLRDALCLTYWTGWAGDRGESIWASHVKDGAAGTALGVATAGYARLRYGRGTDSAPALRAHLRWLRDHAFGDGQSPEALYMLAAFLDNVPPALLVEESVPADWRTVLVQSLIASQRAAPDGDGWAWRDEAGAPSVRQTAFAAAALIALSR